MDAQTPRPREELHRLIDLLADATLQEAETYLRMLFLYPDPVERALALAPWDDEPDTDEDRQAAKAADEEWLRGEARSLEDVRRELGL